MVFSIQKAVRKVSDKIRMISRKVSKNTFPLKQNRHFKSPIYIFSDHVVCKVLTSSAGGKESFKNLFGSEIKKNNESEFSDK